jgi:hypothetical protein
MQKSSAPAAGGSKMEIISDEEFKESLSKAKSYVGIILIEGPNYNSPEARAVIYQHGKRNMSLRKAGKFPVICPVVDGGRIKGLGVFCVSEEEVKEIMDGDPGVQAVIFTYELHPVRGFPGASLP